MDYFLLHFCGFELTNHLVDMLVLSFKVLLLKAVVFSLDGLMPNFFLGV